MKCPQCDRPYRRRDFGLDETYFECDDCGVGLVESDEQDADQSFLSERISGQPTAATAFSYSTLNITAATPGAQITTAEQIARSYDASIIVRRWLARVVDGFAMLVVLIVVLVLAEQLRIPDAIVWLAVVGVWLGYFIVFETWLGRTPGKMLIGLRVVDENGENPGFRRASIRALLSLIELNPVLFGGLPAAIVVFGSEKRQRLGDMAAGTYVLFEADMGRVVRATN
jgi:uncharacterized RDD family membrane protein YckC